MKTLGQREQQVLDYVVATIRTNGYAPCIRDIQSALGFKSTSTVHTYLSRLEAEGYLYKEDGKSRAIRVNEALLASGGIPLLDLSACRAGDDAWSGRNVIGYITFRAEVPEECAAKLFAVCVPDDRCAGKGILKGDTVIVKKESAATEVSSPKAVAVNDGGRVVLRILDGEDGSERSRELLADGGVVLGHVVACLRWYGTDDIGIK